MVTAQQVKDAVIAAGVTEVLHHDCAVCGEWVRYIIHRENLYFVPSCGCSWTPYPELREWQDAADWINMQTNENVRSELMKRFGITESLINLSIPYVRLDDDAIMDGA